MGFFERTGDQAESQTGNSFTSALSVKEFALLERLGPRPVAQVMGASVIRTGWQYLPALNAGQFNSQLPGYRGTAGPLVTARELSNPFTEASMRQVRTYKRHTEVVCELDTRTAAWNLARRRALDRLADEARLVGADAVVGVQLQRSHLRLGARVIEIAVRGTAVRLPDGPHGDSPVLTDLSVQDYWRLHQSGQQPVGVAVTTAVVFGGAANVTRRRRLRTRFRSQELEELSGAFHLAAEAVRARLSQQTKDAGGTGVIGVALTHGVERETLPVASSMSSPEVRGWQRSDGGMPYYVSGRGDAKRSGWVITMHAAGTAIRPRVDGAPSPAAHLWTRRL